MGEVDQSPELRERQPSVPTRPEDVPMPPRPGYLQIPGKTIAQNIKKGKVDPKTLDDTERKHLILWLESRGMQRHRIISMLGISFTEYYRLLREMGEEIDGDAFSLSTVLRRIEQAVEFVCATSMRVALKAEQQGEYSAAASALWKVWRAAKEYSDTLQALGKIEKPPDQSVIRVEVTQQVRQVFAIVQEILVQEVSDRKVLGKIRERVAAQLGGPVD